MPREVTIPVALWVCAALVSHAAIGGGAVGVTHVEEQKAKERADIRDMVLDVRRGLGTIELDIGESGTNAEKTKLELSAKETELGKLGALLDDPKLLPEQRADVERQKRELEKEIEKEVAEKKDEQKKDPEKEPEEEAPKLAKPMELLPPPKDDRLKIRQAARDEKDNETAPRLAEHALSVEEEEIAKARSNNSVSENPSFDSNKDGPRDLEGRELSLDQNGLKSIVDLLSMSFNGGTDISSPMRAAMTKVAEAGWERADVILVSDGEFSVPSDILAMVNEAKQTKALRVHGLIVAQRGYGEQAMGQLCQPLHYFSDWNSVRGF